MPPRAKASESRLHQKRADAFPPASGSVFAKTSSTPATLPFVTQVFVPLSK